MFKRIGDKLGNPVMAGLLAVVCCALWGSAFPAIKTGYKLFCVESGDYSSQILFAGIRFALAGLITVLIGSVLAKKLLVVKSNGLGRVAALSMFQTVLQYVFFYIGLARTTGTKGSILGASSVFFSVIIVSLILRQEKMTTKKLFGCLIGFAGVVLVNLGSGGLDIGFTLTGEGFMIISSLSYSVSSVLIKQFSRYDNPVALSGYQFVLGGIIMIITGLALGGRLETDNYKAVLLLLYLALLSAIAYTLWGVLLKYNDVSRVTVYSFMTPVFGCLMSMLFLGESLAGNGVRIITALVLVSIGITFVNLKEKQK